MCNKCIFFKIQVNDFQFQAWTQTCSKKGLKFTFKYTTTTTFTTTTTTTTASTENKNKFWRKKNLTRDIFV